MEGPDDALLRGVGANPRTQRTLTKARVAASNRDEYIRMRTLQTVLVLIVLSFTACTQLGYVPKKDYDAVQAQLALSDSKLRGAEKELADFQAHRYSTFRDGARVWRMDSADGKSCILLATDGDWKKPSSMAQSCDCQDYLRDSAKGKVKTDPVWERFYCGN